MHRNEHTDPRFKNSIEFSLDEDTKIFTIESLGAHGPDVLFIEALKILRNKCTMYLSTLSTELSTVVDDDDDDEVASNPMNVDEDDSEENSGFSSVSVSG